MGYSKHRPDARLAPFVESIWVQAHAAEPAGSRPTAVLPVGKPDLVVQYGDQFVRIDNGQRTRLAPAHLSGQRTCPIFVRATGTTGLVIVSFWPWGASSFFGSLEDAVDCTPDLCDIVGRHRAEELVESVQRAADEAGSVRAVQCFLLDLLKTRLPDLRVVAAAGQIHCSGGSETVASIAERFGICRRHLTRIFRSTIGISPKVFARIARFQRAAAYRQPGHRWSDVALSAGYCDQAHLNNEFSRLAGTTPASFGRRASTSALGRFFNKDSSSQMCNMIYI